MKPKNVSTFLLFALLSACSSSSSNSANEENLPASNYFDEPEATSDVTMMPEALAETWTKTVGGQTFTVTSDETPFADGVPVIVTDFGDPAGCGMLENIENYGGEVMSEYLLSLEDQCVAVPDIDYNKLDADQKAQITNDLLAVESPLFFEQVPLDEIPAVAKGICQIRESVGDAVLRSETIPVLSESFSIEEIEINKAVDGLLAIWCP